MNVEDLKRDVEAEIERLGGYVYPALFFSAFAELGDKRVVFKTYSVGGVKDEREPRDFCATIEEARQRFMDSVRGALSEVGRGKTLFWRRYPGVDQYDDKFTITTRFFYGEPS